MIQNADDAEATTVWFYVDERQHSTSNLPHPDLAMFQGPALVAANDACFTEEDWKGIQSLQQSIKAEDPFKVGRFGIGFNSVYHLTGEFIKKVIIVRVAVTPVHWFMLSKIISLVNNNIDSSLIEFVRVLTYYLLH